MSLDFPSNPTNGEVYDKYIFDATRGIWKLLSIDSVATINGTADAGDTLVYDGSSWIPGAKSHNYIINGAFDVWQRGTSVAGGFVYTADRWVVDDPVTVSRSTDVPMESGAAYSLFIPATTGAGTIRQAIELPRVGSAGDFADGTTWTLSFWAKSTAARQARFSAAFRPGIVGAADKTAQSAVNLGELSTSWKRFSHTFTIPVGAVPNANCLAVAISSASGSSADFYYTGVQLEAGSVATPFKRHAPSLQGELAACQRYARRYDAQGNAFARFGIGIVDGANNVQIPFLEWGTMRTYPTSLEISAAADFLVETAGGGFTVTSISRSNGSGMSVNTATATPNGIALVRANNAPSAFIIVSSEL